MIKRFLLLMIVVSAIAIKACEETRAGTGVQPGRSLMAQKEQQLVRKAPDNEEGRHQFDNLVLLRNAFIVGSAFWAQANFACCSSRKELYDAWPAFSYSLAGFGAAMAVQSIIVGAKRWTLRR